MYVLFCGDPFAPRQPDPDYAREAAAAQRLGIPGATLDFAALLAGEGARAVRHVPPPSGPPDTPALAVYRGWMLRPADYALLSRQLAAKGFALINTPEAYVHCHHLPESYPIIAPHTPLTRWLPWSGSINRAELAATLAPFGNRPLILKDYVKSRKHEWDEACFIPAANDLPAVERVVRRFVELQGDDLNEGLVFREFVALQPLARHSKSGMPLTKEYRAFFCDGKPIYAVRYWEEGEYAAEEPPFADFAAAARQVRSRFWTMDIAQRSDGGWMIVELGDGQVAGLPEHADPIAFYRALRDHVGED